MRLFNFTRQHMPYGSKQLAASDTKLFVQLFVHEFDYAFRTYSFVSTMASILKYIFIALLIN